MRPLTPIVEGSGRIGQMLTRPPLRAKAARMRTRARECLVTEGRPKRSGSLQINCHYVLERHLNNAAPDFRKRRRFDID